MLARLRDPEAAAATRLFNLQNGTAGMVAAALDDHTRAARLFWAFARQLSDVELYLPERELIQRAEARVRAALGDVSYEQVWAEGYRMPAARSVVEIDALAGDEVPPMQVESSPGSEAGLSPRELEVLQLLAEGRTNQEIADALFVSRHTVASHPDHMLTKLGVRSRTAAVAWAIRNGLRDTEPSAGDGWRFDACWLATGPARVDIRHRRSLIERNSGRCSGSFSPRTRCAPYRP